MIGSDPPADRIINIKGGLRPVKKNLPLKKMPATVSRSRHGGRARTSILRRARRRTPGAGAASRRPPIDRRVEAVNPAPGKGFGRI